MALIKCSECNGTVSDKAKICPHCGFPISDKNENEVVEEKEKKELNLSAIIAFFISVFIFILIISKEVYGKSFKSNVSLMQILKQVKTTIPFIFVYGLSIFIAFLFRIKKKFSTQTIAKSLYVVAAIFLSIFGFVAAKKGYQLNFLFLFHYLLLITLCLIFPINKKEEISDEDKKKEKKKNIRLSIITSLVILTLCVITGCSTLNKSNIKKINNEVSKKQTVEQKTIITDMNSVKEGYKAYATIENDYINVRKCERTSCDKIGKVLKNDVYEIVDIKKDNNYHWYKIKDKNNHEGYIANPKNNKYITTDEFENTIEISSITDFKEEKKEEKPSENTNTNTNNNTNTNTNTNTNKNNNTSTNKNTNTTKPSNNTQTTTPTPKPSQNPTSQEKPKQTIDATPVYGCQTGEILDGTRCYAVLDADINYRCPSGYTLAYHDQCRTTEATVVSPEYYCYTGRLVGNKCVSDGGTSMANARCPDYRYTYSGYTCTMDDEYRYTDAFFNGYTCFENGELRGNMCYYYSNATIKSYTCPNGYTLNDKKCIEN